MSLKLYFDVHVFKSVANQLRERGVDVLRAQEDGAAELPDDQLLTRASQLGRALVSFDTDLLIEAHGRQLSGQDFAGVIFGEQRRMTIGQCVGDLELIITVATPEELVNRVLYLPL